MKKLLKIISFILVMTILASALISCTARPLGQSNLAKKVVGKVGTHNVQYEELYILANAHKSVAEQKYDNKEDINKAILDYVSENIIINYAILDLCASEGLTYNEFKLSSRVEDIIEITIQEYYDGNRADFLDAMLKEGMTDHYYRFCVGVDLLYNDLMIKYQEDGNKIPNEKEELKKYIKDNFIHTWHIAIYIDPSNNETYESEYAKAVEAKNRLNNGETIYDLIRDQTSEDILPHSKSYYGNYYPRGIMDKDFEDAAFSLRKVGQMTDIVKGLGKLPNSEKYVECFYIIEKLENKDEDIENNFQEFSDMAKEAIVYQELEKYKEKLSFEPNDYAKSLDLTNLEAPKNGIDYVPIIIVSITVCSIAAVVASIFIFHSIRAKRFHKKHAKSR